MPTSTRRHNNALVDRQYRRNVIRTTNWTTRLIHALYGEVAEGNLDKSFLWLLPLMNSAVIHGKRLAALHSWAYLSQKATVNGIDFNYDVTPWLGNADRVATGALVPTLNRRAPSGVKALIRQGTPPAEALLVSQGRMIALARTETARVARAIPAQASADPNVKGFRRYRRVPAPGACAFCLALAARGAVYQNKDTAGGKYHQSCRCTTAVEVNPKAVDQIAIHEDDLVKIRVKFANTGKVWTEDLGDRYTAYINRPETRPPDAEFLSLSRLPRT